MRILEVIPLLSIDGGAESFVVYFCNELVRKGHECAILTLYSIDEKLRGELSLSPQVKLYSANKNKGYDLSCSAKVCSIIKNYAPNVVHAHVGAIPYITLSALLYRKSSYFATIHSEASREAGSSYQKWCRQFLFRTGRVRAVTISESSKLSFESFYKSVPELVYNGVPSYTNSIGREKNKGTLRFIHVARCHPIKNQELLLLAFNRVMQHYDNIELDWFGTSIEYPQLFESLQTLFNNHVHYKGSTRDARIEMSTADAFCLTSRMEGMPMTIIEALSVGCIPICTPVGGCKNMIQDGVNGFLSSDMSVEAYSEAIERFIETRENEKEMLRKNAIDSFNKYYSIEKTVNDYLELFSNSN